jgi:transcriptional regulator with XRE-family HTH domain
MRKSKPIVDLAIEVDDCLSHAGHAQALLRYEFQWIKTTRWALGWVSAELAKKMNVSQQAVSRLEAREANASISIQKLKDVAEAMNCQLVYGFIPNRPMSVVASDLHARQVEARRLKRKMPRPT